MTGNIGSTALEQNFPLPGTLPQVIRVFGDLRFHTDGDLVALAFKSEDILWSVEEPGVLRQWNMTTGQPLGSAFLSDLETLWTISDDARVLVSASDDVSLWDMASGRLLSTVHQPSWVTAVAIQNTPARLATGHDDGVVRIWEVSSHRLLHELAGHQGPIGALAFSPEARRLASAGEDRIIKVWDLENGNLLGTLGRHSDRIGGLVWHAEGRLLISSGWDRTARVWDTTTFEPVILLNTHDDQLTALAVSVDGRRLACADSAHAIRVWDPVAGKELGVLQGHDDEIRCLAFSPDGRRLASGGADRVIHLWDSEQGRRLSGHGRPTTPRTHLAVAQNGSIVASTCGGTHLCLWSVNSERLPVLSSETSNPGILAGSRDGKWLAGGGPDQRITLWNAATGKEEMTLEGQAGPVCALAFAPDSKILASASGTDGTVWLWDIMSREPVLVIPMAADACTVESLAFHPAGKILAAGGIDWLATGGSDGAVSLWDVQERKPVTTFNRGTTALAFHREGRWLAATSLMDSICVWDISKQQLATELTGHADSVTCIAYSPDGSWLVSGSDDRTIRIWDAVTGELTAEHFLDTPIKALAFSPDGHYLFTGNGNTTSYQLDVEALLEEGADARTT
jgi:WD40 repeat protein